MPLYIQICNELCIRVYHSPVQVYSFEKHQRQPETTTIYSCHVLILEGILALYDPKVLELLDMRVGGIYTPKNFLR